jgi:hypothetical protein
MFLDLLFRHLRRAETVRSLLRSDRLRTEFTAKILELGVDERQVDAIATLLLPSFAAWAESRASETSAIVDELARRSNEAYPDAIRRAHIAALSETPKNDKRAEFYAKLRWFIFSTETPILLGDSACLFELAGERRFKPIHDAEDQLQRVFLPISAKRLLVGTPYKKPPKVDLRKLNRAIARCSHEFFVTSDRLPLNSGLASSIGSWSGNWSVSQLDALVKQVVDGFETGRAGAVELGEPGQTA